MPVLLAREGGLIPLPASIDRDGIIARLLRYSESSTFPCFRLKRGALYAAEVVGTLQIGKVRLSILPKSDISDEERDKQFLLNLLRMAGYLGVRSLSTTSGVRAASLDPLEAVLAELANEMLDNLRPGVPRRYQEVSVESVTVKGRIDFGRLSRTLPGKAPTVPISYSPLSMSNVLSRTLRWVGESLALMARGAEARQVLGEVLAHLEQVSGPRVTAGEVHGIELSRYEAHWARILEIAKLLANRRFIDPTFAGSTDAFGMLFPLQHLFERILRRLLAEAGKEIGLTVTHRSEPLYLLHDDEDSRWLRLKPDYVFSRESQAILLGDAKWKRLVNGARAYDLERADVYQMNAYLTRYGILRAALFVPRMGWMEKDWRRTFYIPPDKRELHVVSLDIEKLVSQISTAREDARSRLRDSLTAVVGTTSYGGNPPSHHVLGGA